MNCESCNGKDLVSIPFIAHEAETARLERINKRVVIALILAIFMLFACNAAWIYAWCQYDYESTSEVITVDSADGGNANFIGANGDITNYGADRG